MAVPTKDGDMTPKKLFASLEVRRNQTVATATLLTNGIQEVDYFSVGFHILVIVLMTPNATTLQKMFCQVRCI